MMFQPTEEGGERSIEELSDGQRSLFHIAMTAAIIDMEDKLIDDPHCGFNAQKIPFPSLTILALEEPENNLAPFFLSRVIRQVQSLVTSNRAQAFISSHSPSILARIEPKDVRHFQLKPSRTAQVKQILLPNDPEDAARFVREAVQTYPELYFAQFVILGEGSSEEVVLPKLAEAMGLSIDRSFVAIVPLGGRHVNHLWKLLNDLKIHHVTLLDLDLGRAGGGWGRIKTVCGQLLKNGVDAAQLLSGEITGASADIDVSALATFDPTDTATLGKWLKHLQTFHVFFCQPLDLDMTMLRAYETRYKELDDGMRGPSADPTARDRVLGPQGRPDLYDHKDWGDLFSWYRYLFLGRGKPTTHVRALSQMEIQEIKSSVPRELEQLLQHVTERLNLSAFQIATGVGTDAPA